MPRTKTAEQETEAVVINLVCHMTYLIFRIDAPPAKHKTRGVYTSLDYCPIESD